MSAQQKTGPECRIIEDADKSLDRTDFEGGDNFELGGGLTIGSVKEAYSNLPPSLQNIINQAVTESAQFRDETIANVTITSGSSTIEAEKIESSRAPNSDQAEAPEAESREVNTFSIVTSGVYFQRDDESQDQAFQEDAEEIIEELLSLSLKDFADRFNLPGIEPFFRTAFQKQIDAGVDESIASWLNSQRDELDRIAALDEDQLLAYTKDLQESSDGCLSGDPTQLENFSRSRVVNTKLCYGATPFVSTDDILVRIAGSPWIDDQGRQLGYLINIPLNGQPQYFKAPFVNGNPRMIVNPVYFNVLEGSEGPWNTWVDSLSGRS